jgi:glycosyltransferase involved in cell wall biosynthesis
VNTSGAPDATARTAAWELPAFDVVPCAERRHAYALCVFVLNEGERIRAQLRDMRALDLPVDIVIADGGSTDGALEPAFLAEQGVRALLIKRGPGALSAQMRMGFAWCMLEGYAGIVTIDGNGKDDARAVPAFVAALRGGMDHVQGSRYVPGGAGINTPLARHLGVTLLHAPLISIAAGFRYTDTTNGFRAYSRRFLLDERVQPFREVFVGYELHYYLAIRAARLGFRVAELPVTRRYPAAGPVPSKIRGWRGNVHVLRTLWRAVRGAYTPT